MRSPHPVVCVVALSAVVGLTAGCGSPAPLSPADAAPGAAADRRSVAPLAEVEFPLVSGTFSIGNDDRITGTHSGVSTFPAGGAERASLTLRVTGGTGVFAGATGSVSVTGTGAFAGEGAFSLSGSGELMVAGRRINLVLNLRGTSSASCSPRQLIAITQTGSGAMGRAGRVAGTLNHEVESTGCES